MAIRPFALLQRRDIDACADQAREAVRAWQSGWGASTRLEVGCVETFDPTAAQPGGIWRAHRSAPGNVLWCYLSADFTKQVERMIFELDDSLRGADRYRESEVAKGVANTAVEQLIESLLDRLAGPTTALPEPGAGPADWQFRCISGGAVVSTAIGGKALCILIPCEQLPSRLNPGKPVARGPVTPLPAALTGIEVRLIAELGEVQMSLGHFASLEIGDVVKLPVGIDQTLKVFAVGGHPVGVGHLGKQDGMRALEMFKAPHK